MGKRSNKNSTNLDSSIAESEPASKLRKTAASESLTSQSTQSQNNSGRQYKFKNAKFVHSSKAESTGKRHVWKNLKQILATERSLNWKPTDVTYASIDAPPSFLPAKKYSDISGLPAKYVDPHTKLRYATADEFAQIRTLPSDIISGLLQLRKANSLVG